MLAKAYQKYLYISRPVSKDILWMCSTERSNLPPLQHFGDLRRSFGNRKVFMNKGRCYPKNKNVDWIGSYRWFLLE